MSQKWYSNILSTGFYNLEIRLTFCSLVSICACQFCYVTQHNFINPLLLQQMTENLIGEPCKNDTECVKTSVCWMNTTNSSSRTCQCEDDKYTQDNKTCLPSMKLSIFIYLSCLSLYLSSFSTTILHSLQVWYSMLIPWKDQSVLSFQLKHMILHAFLKNSSKLYFSSD